MDIIRDLGDPLPAIVTAELLGVPTSDQQVEDLVSRFCRDAGKLPAQSGARSADAACR